VATLASLSEINEGIKAVTGNYGLMWDAFWGKKIKPSDLAAVPGSNPANYESFVDQTEWVTSDMVY